MSERSYPPKRSVERIWNHGLSVLQVQEARVWLESRALDVARVASADVCRVIHPTMALPDWAERLRHRGYTLMFALRDARGETRSLLFRHPNAREGQPKTLIPRGYKAQGLVLSTGAVPPDASQVVIVEGEVDWMTWVVHSDVHCIGVRSGSWSQDASEHEASIPMAAKVYIRTDCDDAGDKYAKAIGQSLANRQLYRLEKIIDVTVRMDGTAIDDNDRLQKNEFTPDPREHMKPFTPPPRESGGSGRDRRIQRMPTPRGVTSVYGRRALDGEVAKITSQGEGGRNNQLYRSSRAVGNLVAGGEIAQEEALRDLEDAGRAVGLGRREVRSTVKSGLKIGRKRPRRAPEVLPEHYRKERAHKPIASAVLPVIKRTLARGRTKLASALRVSLQQGGLSVIRSVCGSGKTYATCEAVIEYCLEHSRALVHVVVPTHQIMQEVYELYRKRAQKYRIHVAKAVTRCKEFCVRHAEVAAVARVAPYGPRKLCKQCEFYTDEVACRFWAMQLAARSAKILITTHALAVQPDPEAAIPDVVIIDESVWRSVRGGGSLSREDIARLRDAGDLVSRGDAKEVEGAILSPLERLTRLMYESERDGSLLSAQKLQAALPACEIECPMMYEEADKTLKAALTHRGPSLIEMCEKGVGWQPVRGLGEALLDGWQGTYIHKGVLHAAYATPFETNGTHATIVLDATTTLAMARAVHGDDARLIEVEVDLPSGLEIIWVRANTGSRSRVGQVGEGLRSSRAWLATLLHWGRFEGCLNVTHKRWREDPWTKSVFDGLAPLADVIHHGGIEARGSNQYKSHHTARIDAYWVPRPVVELDAILLARLARWRINAINKYAVLPGDQAFECFDATGTRQCRAPSQAGTLKCTHDLHSACTEGGKEKPSLEDTPVLVDRPPSCEDTREIRHEQTRCGVLDPSLQWKARRLALRIFFNQVNWCFEARWQLEGSSIVQVAARIRLYDASEDSPKRLVFIDTRSPEHFGFAPTQVYEVEELLWEVFGEASYHCARQVLDALLKHTKGVLAPTIEGRAADALSERSATESSQQARSALVSRWMDRLQISSTSREPTSLSQRLCGWVHKFFQGSWETFAGVCGVRVTMIQTEHGGGAIPILHSGELSAWQIERCLSQRRGVKRWRQTDSEIWHQMPGTCPPLVEALLQIDDLDLSLGSTAMCKLVARHAQRNLRTVQRWVAEHKRAGEDNKSVLIRLWHDTHAEATLEAMDEARVLAEERGASREEAEDAACQRGREFYVPPWKAPFLKDTPLAVSAGTLPRWLGGPGTDEWSRSRASPAHQPWLNLLDGVPDWAVKPGRVKK